MPTFTTKYNVNDVVYFVIKSKVCILKAHILYVHPSLTNITYNIVFEDDSILNTQTLGFVKEADLFSFSEAKSILLSWLNSKIDEVEHLVEP